MRYRFVAVGTMILYSLTGCTDPGYVHSAVFQNHETTEFVSLCDQVEQESDSLRKRKKLRKAS